MGHAEFAPDHSGEDDGGVGKLEVSFAPEYAYVARATVDVLSVSAATVEHIDPITRFPIRPRTEILRGRMDDLLILIPTTNPKSDVMPQKGKRRPLISTETHQMIVQRYVEHLIRRNEVVLDELVIEEVTARTLPLPSC